MTGAGGQKGFAAIKEKPRRRWALGGAFNGRFALEGYVLDSGPSVDAGMTR